MLPEVVTSNYPWLIAAGASIGAFWRQFMTYVNKIKNFVFVEVQISGETPSAAFIAYMQDTYSTGKYNTFKYGVRSTYVNPLKRSVFVALKTLRGNNTFYHKGFPIFIQDGKKDENRTESSDNIKVSFIRGTFDFETAFIAAIDVKNEREDNSNGKKHRGHKRLNRYYIKRHFGRTQDKDYDRNGKSLAEAPSDNTSESSIPLKWTKDDLKQPNPENPFSHLAYGKEVKDFMIRFEHWLDSKEWYESKGLDHRDGALFIGKPGSGKTSCARAIGQWAQMPIHIFDLTTLTNQELVSAWKEMLSDAPAVALFEDMDRLFDENRIFLKGSKNGLTLDTLLNCIGGVEPANGILTIVTANFVERLDPALGVPDSTGKSTRPGRLDTVVNFADLDRDSRVQIATNMLDEYPEQVMILVEEGEGETGAQFVKRCADKAIELYWKNLGFHKTILKTDELALTELESLRNPLDRYDEPELKSESQYNSQGSSYDSQF